MTTVTIGFTPRERFSPGARCLQRIFDCTDLPFQLIVIDCGMPERYRQEIDAVIDGRTNVEVVRFDRYVTTNEARNLVVGKATGEYVCLTEMDILVQQGWLSYLIEACERHPADAAFPLVIEGENVVHGNPKLSRIEQTIEDGREAFRLMPRETPKESDRTGGIKRIDVLEDHCMLFRRSVFDRIGPLDATLATRYEVDLSLALHQAGLVSVLEPRSQVYFVEPPPIEPEERDFFLFRYDKRNAKRSEKYLVQKWNLIDLPTTRRFFNRRLRLLEG